MLERKLKSNMCQCGSYSFLLFSQLNVQTFFFVQCSGWPKDVADILDRYIFRFVV